jgi:VIT1/CCC1 family predicted Fe2+/Mn2+ transporter
MRRIEYLENLVRNWEETFGKTSDEDLEHVFNLKGNYSAVLSPIRLASLLRNRLKENETLKKEINKMLQSKQDEIDKAEKAISDHFKQTREQFRRDSERLTTKVEKELNKL